MSLIVSNNTTKSIKFSNDIFFKKTNSSLSNIVMYCFFNNEFR